jgi:transmembrane sensor
MTAGQPDGAEQREDEAIGWIVRLNSGEATEADWRAHADWLAADPAHVRAYADAEALWVEVDDQADGLRRGLEALDAAPIVVPMPSRPRPARRRLGVGWAVAAAAAGLVVITGGYAWFSGRPTTYQTAPGQSRAIALSDGSRIDLNGASRLSVRYDRKARRVALADAEAAFDVAKDPDRPFLISAGDQRIRVVGTAFDVDRTGDRLTVTVRRGVVEVSSLDGRGGAPARIPAGYQFRRDGAGGVASLRAVDPNDAFAWREHRLVFHGESLAQVAQALSRAFATPVQAEGPAASLPFTGVLVLDDEDAVLRRLQSFLPIQADRSGNAIVLKPRT